MHEKLMQERHVQIAIDVGYYEDDGKFLARCVQIPCCTGTGKTADEAISDALDTIQGYIAHRNFLGLSPFVDCYMDQAN